MPRTRTRFILRAPAVAAALLCSLAGLAATPSPSAAPGGASYVALGDSYAAGYGLADPTGAPVAACAQSARDYPHRVAQRLALDLTDVSCATATTADLRAASDAGAPAQLDSLGPDTRVVTVTIGGNDSGLFLQAFSCLALTAQGPVIAGEDVQNCRSRFVRGGIDRLRRDIDGTISRNIADSVTAIRRAAPAARVVMVGYPTIFPDVAHTPPSGCFRPALTAESFTGKYPENSFPFTDVDVRYFSGVQRALDDASRRVAQQAGASYVSMLTRTAAHSACATDAPYINGLQLSSPDDVEHVELDPGALHPNEAGTEALADAAAAEVRSLLAPRPTGSPEASPSRSAGPGAAGAAPIAGAVIVVAAALVTGGLLLRRRRRRITRS